MAVCLLLRVSDKLSRNKTSVEKTTVKKIIKINMYVFVLMDHSI